MQSRGPQYTEYQQRVGLAAIALQLALLRLKKEPAAIADIHRELELLAEFDEPERWTKIKLVSSFLLDEDWQALNEHRESLEELFYSRVPTYADAEALASRLCEEERLSLAIDLLESLPPRGRDNTSEAASARTGWVVRKRRVLCWEKRHPTGRRRYSTKKLLNDVEVSFVEQLQEERIPIEETLLRLEAFRRNGGNIKGK